MVGAAEEVADVVAKAAVPFLPTVADETTNLIKAGGIPRFGDHLDARELGIGLDVPEDGRTGHHLPGGVAGEDRGKVEAEAVHVHFGDPIAETVQDHAANDG